MSDDALTAMVNEETPIGKKIERELIAALSQMGFRVERNPSEDTSDPDYGCYRLIASDGRIIDGAHLGVGSYGLTLTDLVNMVTDHRASQEDAIHPSSVRLKTKPTFTG